MTTSNSLHKFRSKRRKKRVSPLTKIKYQKPSARNQKKQISVNARQIAYLNKVVKSNKLYCDWQMEDEIDAPVDPAGSFTRYWGIFDLMLFRAWLPVLRQSEAVSAAARTYIARMSINMRYELGASNWAQVSIFVCTPRRNATSLEPQNVPPILGQGYIDSTRGYNARLNPAMYKVHYARYMTLTKNSFLEPVVSTANVGNPSTTWKKGQINIPIKCSIRAPYTNPLDKWKLLDSSDLPYYQRYFLMVYVVQQAPAGTPAGGAFKCSFDALATTINFE